MFKTCSLFLFLLLLAGPRAFSQHYIHCLEGEVVSIVSPCNSCFEVGCYEFVLQGDILFSDSLPQTVQAYEMIGYAQQGGQMLRLSKTDTKGNTLQAVINITTGKIIVPMNVHTVGYDYEGKLLVAGVSGSYMADTEGNILFRFEEDISSGAFCETGWYLHDGLKNTSHLFNKEGKKLSSFKGREIVKQVDSLHFIVRTEKGPVYLVDIRGKTVFGDGCAHDMQPSVQNNDGVISTALITSGLCYQDDDVTLIIHDKKGKWFDPLKAFTKKYYVEYVLPIHIQSTNENEWFCYVAGYDIPNDKIMVALLNHKGEIVLRLQANEMHRPYYVLRDSAFIYLLNEYSSESHMVFLADGTLLLEDRYNYRSHLDPSIESLGYFCFVNHVLNSTYLYHAGSKKLLTLEGVEYQFLTLEEVEERFR